MKHLTSFFCVVAMTVCFASCGTKTVIIEKPIEQDVVVPAIEQEQEAPLGQWIKCRVCDGKGQCQNCQGKGKVDGVDCRSCKGTGRCSVCDGEGGHRE